MFLTSRLRGLNVQTPTFVNGSPWDLRKMDEKLNVANSTKCATTSESQSEKRAEDVAIKTDIQRLKLTQVIAKTRSALHY